MFINWAYGDGQLLSKFPHLAYRRPPHGLELSCLLLLWHTCHFVMTWSVYFNATSKCACFLPGEPALCCEFFAVHAWRGLEGLNTLQHASHDDHLCMHRAFVLIPDAPKAFNEMLR